MTSVPGRATAWAVGDDSTCFYDGKNWTRVEPPGAPDLASVTAVSAADVWAVGATVTCDPFSCHSASEIQHWNGGQWNSVRNPLASELRGVDATAAADVWAVGTNNLGTVIEHWDGSSWRIVPSPDPESGGALNAVDAETASAMWSAGYFYADTQQRTLTLQAPSLTQGQVVDFDLDCSL